MFPRGAAEGNNNGGRRSSVSDVIDIALLPAQILLAGNSFILRCHVTSR